MPKFYVPSEAEERCIRCMQETVTAHTTAIVAWSRDPHNPATQEHLANVTLGLRGLMRWYDALMGNPWPAPKGDAR